MSTAPTASLLHARVLSELDRRLAEPLAPGLHLVATPIGNLGDITLRALATLWRADLICCEDTRHSRTLLSHFGISRPLRALHEHNEMAEADRVVALLGEGKAVALISDAGMPLVSDPGARLVGAVIAAGQPVHVVPGPSAVLAGLAVSGLPSDTFLFAGFLPARGSARRERLTSLLAQPATVILFEAPGRLAVLLGELDQLAKERPVVVARELTKRFEEIRRGRAAEVAAAIAEAKVQGEIVVLVGPPQARTVADAEILAALNAARKTMSLRDAARTVAEALSVPRARVYELGLKAQAAPDRA